MFNQNPTFPSQNVNSTPQIGGYWSNSFPYTTNFRFPPNPVAQPSAPHTTKADVGGIQAAMQKRSKDADNKPSATCENKASYKHDKDGHTTGQAAFDTLDSYMKKAGLNSFQASFFSRLSMAGFKEAEFKEIVKKAGLAFGPEVESELNEGLEKIAVISSIVKFAPKALPLLKGIGSSAMRGLGLAAKQAPKAVYSAGRSAATRAGKGIASGASQAAKGISQLKPSSLANAAKRTVTDPSVRRSVTQGAITGTVNPYTGLNTWVDSEGNVDYGRALSSVLGGAAMGRLNNRTLQGMQRRALAGEGIGLAGGYGARALGYDVDPETFARAGFAGGAFTPRKFMGKPLVTGAGKGLLDKIDPFGQAYRYAGRGLSSAGSWAAKNPTKALQTGGILAAGAGGVATPFIANNAIARAQESLQKQVSPMIDYGTQTLQNVNKAAKNPLGSLFGEGSNIGNMLGSLGKTLQEKPLLAMLLLGGLGAGGGGLLGGRTGATLGGLSLPLIYMLMSGNFAGANAGGGQQQNPEMANAARTQQAANQAKEDAAASEVLNNPQANQATSEASKPEVVRQQEQQATPGDAAANQSSPTQVDPVIGQLFYLATPEQQRVLTDESIPVQLKQSTLKSIAQANGISY